MAIIQLGELISNIRGSIGGVTFSKNRAGQIAKKRSAGRKSYSNNQANELKYQAYVSRQWQILTLTNKNLWNSYALLYPSTDRYGTVKSLSGFNYFCKVNNLNYKLNNLIMLTPPERVAPAVISSFDILATNNTLKIKFPDAINYDDNTMFIFASLPSQTTSSKNRGKIRLVSILTNPIGEEFDITADWELYFKTSYSKIASKGKFLIHACIYLVSNLSFENGIQICSVGVLHQSPYSTLLLVGGGNVLLTTGGKIKLLNT